MRKLIYKVVNGKIILTTEDKVVVAIIEQKQNMSIQDTIEEYMMKNDMYLPMYQLHEELV